jgi:error-prone DNA polymerase
VIDYAELHCVSNFTFLRGASQPQELIERAHALGYRALAITDECSVAGIVRAHAAAKAAGFPLIVGAELRLECGLACVALATDRRGYAALCRLITRGRRAAEKGTYRLAFADLEATLERCLVLWLPPSDLADTQRLIAQARQVRERFGGDAWCAVELLREGRDAVRLAALTRIAAAADLPLVASGDVHMHGRARRRLQDVLTAIRLGVPVAEAGHALYRNGERHLRERERLAKLYPPALLAATLEVADRCTFSLDELRYQYPREIVPDGETATSWLRKLTEAGIRQRWPLGEPPKVRELIEHELALIAELGYEPYFLTVQDIVAFARSERILCQGRGSAANSAVCYALGVTEVDPARMSMLMERFISRERNEPPDIDIDFEHERREQVIQYLYRKYGRERTALTATVISYRPRSALRDLGKALGLDPVQVERLAGSMQWWDSSAELGPRVRDAGFDPASPVLHRLIGLARELCGFPRHLSQHVGGFVIAAGALEELVPIENAAMPERTVIQWDKDDLDELGLLKVDVLGLGMLSAIRRALASLTRLKGRRFGIADIPEGDTAVYDMICRADTVGVFQIESRAQMSMLPRLKPRNFYDLVIEVAIVRPGPIQGDMVHPYLRRRTGEEPVVYPSREVEGVLRRTLGVPLFQEQVMQLAVVAAGFTPGEADQLRRSMAAWKRRGGLGHFEQRLLEGMRARGYTEQFAQQIFRQILGFGEYGFPECVSGDTRVVDADTGRWVTIDAVVSGQARLANTLACDDELRLRKRKVLAVMASGTKPVLRLSTERGHTILASKEHPFLTMEGWRELARLQVGDCVAVARSMPVSANRHWPRHHQGDVCWDTIVSIEAKGPQPTYDIKIEGDHNFVANNFIVHNSHAASFALLVYVSAWLKHHEPAVFTCALLNSLPMGFYAPAQLVRDARAHGIEVRPVSVVASDWESTLEDGRALRLGMRLVNGLGETAALRVVGARAARPFRDVQDLTERAALDRGDLEALAAAGALSAISGHRYRAFWDVAGNERALPTAPPATAGEGVSLLGAPTEGENIVADYHSLGLTLGRHPLALLRERLARDRIVTARELDAIPNGRRVRAAGLVVTRQRPGSASGVTFVTIEDETGCVNLVVWESVGEAQRRPLLESRLLEVRGTLQREGLVTHVIAERLLDRSALLGALVPRSRNFH